MTLPADGSSPGYGVIFSGGGALASWEIGCYKALLRHHGGTAPSVVTGASAGAINAAAIASGYSSDELVEIWTNISAADVFRPPSTITKTRLAIRLIITSLRHFSVAKGLSEVASHHTALLSSEPLRETLQQLFAAKWEAFSEHEVAFATTATNLSSGNKLIFYSAQPPTTLTSGEWRQIEKLDDLILALMGTCALPVVFPPVHHPETDEPLFDGGILRNDPLGPALDYRVKKLYVVKPSPESPVPCGNLREISKALIGTWVGLSFGWQIELTEALNISLPQDDQIKLSVIEPEYDLTDRYDASILSFSPLIIRELIEDGERRTQELLSQ